MNGTTKRRVGFGALTGLVIAGVIGVNTMNVSGQVVTTADPYPSTLYGTLTIGLTNRAGSVTLDPVDGPTLTQAIRTENPSAKIILDPIQVAGGGTIDGTLLDFTSLTGNVLPANSTLAPGGTVQIPSTLLGVESGTNCGTPSGQVGPNEALKISLGSYFDAVTSPDVSVVSGTLVIGKTNNQDKELQIAYDKDTYTTADFTAAPNIPVGGASVTSAGFDESITLRSTATSNSRGLSLKSGTVFNLGAPGAYDYAVECDEMVADEGDPGDIALSATFYRAQDNKGPNQCTDEVGITVEIFPTYVYWNNATVGVNDIPQAVAGLVTVNWAPIPTALGPVLIQDRLAREIDYDAEGPSAFVPVQWCLSFTENPPVGGVRSFTVDMPPTVGPSPTDVPWCLASDTQTLVGGNIMQTQQYYGQGDPWNR